MGNTHSSKRRPLQLVAPTVSCGYMQRLGLRRRPRNHINRAADNKESEKQQNSRVEIPNDIVIEVLLRLPPKSLARLMCGSKSLQSLISQRSRRYNADMLILSKWSCIQEIELEEGSQMKAVRLNCPLGNESGFRVIGSCNGLLCIQTIQISGGERFVVWNPWTGRYKIAAKPSYTLHSLHSEHYGFGYDHSTNDYKIVRIIYNRKRRINKFEIYSRNTDSWKKKGSFRCREGDLGNDLKLGIFLNGSSSLYWGFHVIIRFDLRYNTFSKIALPYYDDHIGNGNGDGEPPNFDLRVFGGRLCMVRYHFHPEHALGGSHIEIWAMEEIGKKHNWVKLMSIPHGKNLPFRKGLAITPLRFMENNRVLMDMKQNIEVHGLNHSYYTSKFYLYNSIEEKFTEFEIQDIHQSRCVSEVTTYTRTLISP